MKRSGRVNILIVLGLVGIVAVAVLIATSGEGPSSVAARFMSGLAEGNVDEVAATSTIPDEDPATQKQEWKQCLESAKHYHFRWHITTETPDAPDSTSVLMKVERNLGPNSYEEDFQLPMKKVNGQWKVQARSVSRLLFPFMPR